MVRAWEHSHNFELYEDVLPVLEELRRHRLKIGLVSNTARDLERLRRAPRARRRRGRLARAGSARRSRTRRSSRTCSSGSTSPPALAAMVGDSVDDDIEGARALGMRAFLLDREGAPPGRRERLTDLRELPAALGLARGLARSRQGSARVRRT